VYIKITLVNCEASSKILKNMDEIPKGNKKDGQSQMTAAPKKYFMEK
jgi:hypothetical protein